MQAIKPLLKKISWILLFVFLLLLAKVILFKNSPHYYKNYFSNTYHSYKIDEGIKKANFKPFATIKMFYASRKLNLEYKMENLLGNIIAFIPLGFLLPLLVRRLRYFFVILLIGFSLSLFFELTQLVTGIGIFDVDDIILNTSGAVIGFVTFVVIKKLFPNKPAGESINKITPASMPD